MMLSVKDFFSEQISRKQADLFKFTKQQCWSMKTPVLESLFNKVASLKIYNFMQKRLQQSCFSVNIA